MIKDLASKKCDDFHRTLTEEKREEKKDDEEVKSLNNDNAEIMKYHSDNAGENKAVSKLLKVSPLARAFLGDRVRMGVKMKESFTDFHALPAKDPPEDEIPDETIQSPSKSIINESYTKTKLSKDADFPVRFDGIRQDEKMMKI